MPPLAPTAAAVLATLALLLQTPPALAGELPDLGDSSSRTLSLQAERSLGERSMGQLRAAGAVLDDPEVNAYLQQLGQRLVSSDPAIAAMGFEFFAVPDPLINAFALPGGHIGVNTGLILAARSESELASVLAHEISHVSQRHIARQLEAQSGNSLAMLGALAAGIVAAASGNGEVANAAIAGAVAGQAQSQIDYTRAHEREADRLGFELLRRAGFDAGGMATFFERMQQLTRTSEGNTPRYLRSHPLTHERIAEAQDRARAEPYRQVAGSLDFALVQALLASYREEPGQAVTRLRARLAAAPAGEAAALRYGLAAALLRAEEPAAAWTEIETLDAAGVRHPMIDALAGQILQQGERLDQAIARYEAGLARYPGHRQLVQDYPRALLRAGRARDAAEFARQRIAGGDGDASLHLLAAEAHAGLGQRLASHYHQGEAYAAMGNLPAAVEQLEIALKSHGGDEITRQIAESRLHTLRNQVREQLRQRATDSRGLGALPGFTPR